MLCECCKSFFSALLSKGCHEHQKIICKNKNIIFRNKLINSKWAYYHFQWIHMTDALNSLFLKHSNFIEFPFPSFPSQCNEYFSKITYSIMNASRSVSCFPFKLSTSLHSNRRSETQLCFLVHCPLFRNSHVKIHSIFQLRIWESSICIQNYSLLHWIALLADKCERTEHRPHSPFFDVEHTRIQFDFITRTTKNWKFIFILI